MVANMRPTRMPSASVPAVGSFRPQPATGFGMVVVGEGAEEGERIRGKQSSRSMILACQQTDAFRMQI